MYRSPYSFETSSYAGSLQSSGYTMDETSSQLSSASRPSAKNIYMQRKEYAESINQQFGKLQYRVEHLFTCEVDGREVRGVEDCIERLKLLDGMGRVWGQDMILQAKDSNLLLTDIETKEELEAIALSRVQEVRAVLDSCVYNSLLMITVQEHSKQTTSTFMFQCEAVRADFVQKELDRVLRNRRDDAGGYNNHRAKLGPAVNHRVTKSSRPLPEETEFASADVSLVDWGTPDYDGSPAPTPPVSWREKDRQPPKSLPPPAPYTERERDVDVLNHLINDIEAFVGKVAAVAPNADKKKKKNKSKKGMPPREDFEICLQKIKTAFNVLGVLNGKINDPSAQELVHCLFSTLEYVVSHCPEDLPPSVVAPLLIPECIHLLSEEATPEEDQLWQSLGDAWNIPSTKWPEDDEDIPTYTPVFDDGWEPQEPSQTDRKPVARQASQRSEGNTNSKPWKSSQKSPDEPLPSFMRVLYDFTARNQRELTVSKGEIVQLLDMSKQWWRVRNDQGEEGHVPNNILKSSDKEDSEAEEMERIPVLTRKSKSAEVKAWLEYKGFSKITVRCLGVLSGSMLLGMTREELKIVCPEEGGRVFYQLQNVKSAMALAKDVRPFE